MPRLCILLFIYFLKNTVYFFFGKRHRAGCLSPPAAGDSRSALFASKETDPKHHLERLKPIGIFERPNPIDL